LRGFVRRQVVAHAPRPRNERLVVVDAPHRLAKVSCTARSALAVAQGVIEDNNFFRAGGLEQHLLRFAVIGRADGGIVAEVAERALVPDVLKAALVQRQFPDRCERTGIADRHLPGFEQTGGPGDAGRRLVSVAHRPAFARLQIVQFGFDFS
jgi:hypothetical protein